MRKAAILVCVLAGSAAADVPPDDAAKATQLFNEARRLLNAGEVDVACTTFADSLALDPQIGTRLNLADCRERQGRLVDAYNLFQQVADEASQTGKGGRLTFAHSHLASLTKRLGQVQLHVAEQKGVAVTLAGKLVPRAAWGTMQVVAPGTFVVEAIAPGHPPLHLEKAANPGELVDVEIPVLAANPGTQPDPPPPPPTPPTVLPPPPPKTHVSRVPLIVTAGGATLFAASIGVAFHARSRWQDATDARDKPGVDAALHEADLATVVGAAGLVAGGIGVYLYLRAPHAPHITPSVDGHTASLSYSGQF